MSGQKELTASDRLKKFEESVYRYIEEGYLNLISINVEACAEACNLTPDQLRDITNDEAMIHSYSLYSYAHHLQDEYGRNLIKLNFAEDNIRKIVASQVDQFGKYTKHEIKVEQIIKENKFAEKLDLIRRHAQARLDALDGKVRDVRRMAEILMNNARSRD